MDTHLGGCLYHPFRDFGFAANPNGMVLPDPLDEIVLVQSLYVMIDTPTIGFECLNGIRTDVFQQKYTQVLVLDWM